MRRLLCCRGGAAFAACAALFFVGCGSPGVKVDGKLVKDGKPFITPPGQMLSLSFVGKDADGKEATFAAAVRADGTFEVVGPKAGIPPGTYKVKISVSTESSDPDSLNKIETLNGQFALVNQKDCVIEAGDAGKKLTIDVDKATVTK